VFAQDLVASLTQRLRGLTVNGDTRDSDHQPMLLELDAS
jgi:hypothetical protein